MRRGTVHTSVWVELVRSLGTPLGLGERGAKRLSVDIDGVRQAKFAWKNVDVER